LSDHSHKDYEDPVIPKYYKWLASIIEDISKLVASVIHPISRQRLESHAVVICLKELAIGFNVLSAELVAIDHLSVGQKQTSRKIVLLNHTNRPDRAVCLKVIKIKPISTVECSLVDQLLFGDYSDLTEVLEIGASLSGHQDHLINKLNKEI
jgi:hypothetical protein